MFNVSVPSCRRFRRLGPFIQLELFNRTVILSDGKHTWELEHWINLYAVMGKAGTYTVDGKPLPIRKELPNVTTDTGPT